MTATETVRREIASLLKSWHKISIQNRHLPIGQAGSSFCAGAIYALRELAQAYPKE